MQTRQPIASTSGRRCSAVHRPAVSRRTVNVPRAAAEPVAKLSYSHVLLAILDPNAFLSDGSKQATATAALFADQYKGKVSVLVIDEPSTHAREPEKQVEAIKWHLKETGCTNYTILQRQTDKPASVLVGEVVDEIEADLLILSSEAVHAKHVDANQLAEFVACPYLMLP